MKLPKLNNLTAEQKEVIDSGGNFAVFGGAGTGKTMVAIWRHIHNIKAGKNSYLITFTHTLTYFLSNLVNQEVANKNIDNADSFIKNLQNSKISDIQELIIDESQDLSFEKYHNIIKKSNLEVSFGVDDNQHIYQNTTTQKKLEEFYNPQTIKELTFSFRNGFNILILVKTLFKNYGVTDKMVSYAKKYYMFENRPNLIIYRKENIFLDFFRKTISNIPKENSIGILVPTTKLMNIYRSILNEYLGNANYTSYNYLDLGNVRNIGIDRIHLTTFHSSKGLEFDYVIIPEFQEFSVSNKYYVGLTRAKIGLYLFSQNINPLSQVDNKLYNLVEI